MIKECLLCQDTVILFPSKKFILLFLFFIFQVKNLKD